MRATNVDVVFGLRVSDGRRIVVKVHQPRESRETLQRCTPGSPCCFAPASHARSRLVAPTTLGNGLAVIESLLDDGEFCDTHRPTLRRSMAEALACHLELACGCGCPAALTRGWNLYTSDGLWPHETHAPIFFEATAAGAEWIDAIATRVKPLATAGGESLIGHSDWSGKHFRFSGDRITAVYDWDSVRMSREPVIVGNAARPTRCASTVSASLVP